MASLAGMVQLRHPMHHLCYVRRPFSSSSVCRSFAFNVLFGSAFSFACYPAYTTVSGSLSCAHWLTPTAMLGEKVAPMFRHEDSLESALRCRLVHSIGCDRSVCQALVCARQPRSFPPTAGLAVGPSRPSHSEEIRHPCTDRSFKTRARVIPPPTATPRTPRTASASPGTSSASPGHFAAPAAEPACQEHYSYSSCSPPPPPPSPHSAAWWRVPKAGTMATAVATKPAETAAYTDAWSALEAQVDALKGTHLRDLLK